MNLFDEIKKVLAPVSILDEEEIKPEQDLHADLGIDSFSTMESVIELESKYDIEFEDKKIRSLITVQDVVDYVRQKIAAACGEGGDYETV